jgi:hypothetical protein
LSEQRCQLAALVVTDGDRTPPDLAVDGVGESPEVLANRLGKTVWRYTFSVPTQGEDGVVYAIGAQRWRIFPPAGECLRIAYTSCNGFEHNNQLDEVDPWRNERWRHLASVHAKSPFQLLVQGGDQLYADDVWRKVPELATWRTLNQQAQIAARLSSPAEQAIKDFYFDSYCRLWAQSALAPVVASIPSLMMWDDHDIFDGWGSHSYALQNCSVFRSVGAAAREQFALFQLAALPEELPTGFGDPQGSHFGWAFQVNDVGIIAPDLRSERTRQRVMGEVGWHWFEAALERLSACQQVFLVSSVPVINLDLSLVERLVAPLPPGRHFYQDDLRDQWRSYQHRREWRRLVNHLLDFSQRTQTRVTILSGEIHLAALGVLKHAETQIYQLTASGIVHHPPPRLLASLFDVFSRGSRTVSKEVSLRMLPLPGFGCRYLAARNWLSLDHTGNSLQAHWHVEESSKIARLSLA